MKRRFFNLAAAASLLFCLACLFMWGRSGWMFENMEVACPGPGWVNISSYAGQVIVETSPWQERGWSSMDQEWNMQWDWPTYSTWRTQFPGMPGTLSLHPPFYTLPPDFVVHRVIVPYWLSTLLAAILPAIWFWQRRKEKKVACRRGFEVLSAAMLAPPEGQKRD